MRYDRITGIILGTKLYWQVEWTWCTEELTISQFLLLVYQSLETTTGFITSSRYIVRAVFCYEIILSSYWNLFFCVYSMPIRLSSHAQGSINKHKNFQNRAIKVEIYCIGRYTWLNIHWTLPKEKEHGSYRRSELDRTDDETGISARGQTAWTKFL